MKYPTLAKSIIYGTPSDISTLIEAGAPLEEVDEYGYTPIVEAAIVGDVDKAKVLLDAGADPNFSDLTGRTALHWATDNNNYAMSQLLLERGADANAATRAGQCVLAMPLLRGYDDIKQLLYKHGAKLVFAQDFVNTKLLGHRFALEGRADIINHEGRFIEVELEGFYLQFSLAIVLDSLLQFRNHFSGRHLRQFFPQLDMISRSLYVASELFKFQHYTIDIEQHNQNIDELLGHSPLVIPLSYEGHAINLIQYEDWLIRCDRGEFGAKNGTVIIYKVGLPARLNRDFIREIIYTRQYRVYVEEELSYYLELEPIDTLPLTPQVSGNCSWSNVEAVVPTLMYLLQLAEADQYDESTIRNCKQNAIDLYETWIEWDKRRALDFCVQSFYSANPARKATKAALLTSILFQTCEFENEDDLDTAEKIIRVVKDPQYNYIIKAYVDAYNEDRDDPLYKNFLNFLDFHEVDIDQL